MRAGEAGNGFAVVASGVKKLANQTAQATEDIAQQVRDIQEAVERTGRPLEAVIMNPRSDPQAYAVQARSLIVDHKVAAIFGCWTSASRKEVLPVVEELNGLLFYPSQYEGEEESPNIFYTGATPQQQAIPAVDYLLAKGRKRFFLLGTDTVYPRTTNAILRAYLAAQGIEGELPAIAGPEMAGHLAAWSYLHEIDSPENKAFIAAWRNFCGAPNVVTDDPMEATWIGFHLWKAAVARARSLHVDEVRDALGGLRVRAPSGFEVVMDKRNHHLHKPAVIGRITEDARIVPEWISKGLVAPEPWSPWLVRVPAPYRTRPNEITEIALAS